MESSGEGLARARAVLLGEAWGGGERCAVASYTVNGNRHFGITDLPILVLFFYLFWALAIPHKGRKLAQNR